ncbi:MAG: UDP-2,3-diacylglucosamine diphosphatase [Gammaproteobacteria bacterium]|nr:UDP-2,3-diacylglucosamine diphosphatase [Gammaproteobacteria bacterium]
MAQAFIADLHLTMERPEAVALFETLLVAAVGRIDHLYILGDLFEYWIGDDGGREPEFAPVLAALKNATARGLPISVMHGNRDFLLSEGFAGMTGCQLLPDPYRLDLFGTPTLLSHGDALCTDDIAYMAMRRQFRDPRWQAQVLARGIPERMAMARALRAESGTATGSKTETIMDVNADAVRALLRQHGLQRLIHGHTHRPGHYHLGSTDGTLERVVVGDWYEGSSLLVAGPGGLRLTAATDLVGAVAQVMGR